MRGLEKLDVKRMESRMNEWTAVTSVTSDYFVIEDAGCAIQNERSRLLVASILTKGLHITVRPRAPLAPVRRGKLRCRKGIV